MIGGPCTAKNKDYWQSEKANKHNSAEQGGAYLF